MRHPTHSNCLVWAIRQWWTYGGVLRIVWSPFGWWPHADWESAEGVRYEFYPTRQKRRRRLPPFWFEGSVRIVRETA